jgi:hypothetical protein
VAHDDGKDEVEQGKEVNDFEKDTSEAKVFNTLRLVWF